MNGILNADRQRKARDIAEIKCEQLTAKLAKAESALADARAALQKYGGHYDNCALERVRWPGTCSCGYDAALGTPDPHGERADPPG